MTTGRTGQLLWRSGAAYVRIRTGAARRTLIRLVACDSERSARQRIDRVTALADRLIAAGRANVVLYFAKRAAKAGDEKELRGIERAVEALTTSRMRLAKRRRSASSRSGGFLACCTANIPITSP